jgi:hypothetical protein
MISFLIGQFQRDRTERRIKKLIEDEDIDTIIYINKYRNIEEGVL